MDAGKLPDGGALGEAVVDEEGGALPDEIGLGFPGLQVNDLVEEATKASPLQFLLQGGRDAG